MLATAVCRGAWRGTYGRPLASSTSGYHFFPNKRASDDEDAHQSCALHSTLSAASSITPSPSLAFPITRIQIRTLLSTSSFSALPAEEERKEKSRVDSLSPYQREMELRKLDADLARLQTLRAINTGELYTFRGKFKMLSRDYGMGFLAWYWSVWFATAGLSYAAIELGGVDPLMVAAKVETFMGWEPMSIQGRLDPTLGQIGLVVAVNECLEPLRLPFVVVTTKPVVNFFSNAGR
eukprot:CAMPEP_0172551682 /NCGR_PEP_ID=MMETSP1067-20121228/40139_1 /TAXON_ID=265564 ORGANISM="Thalassiosira punctigera, Strain Tpunct2005C2" /NCGR_SAMPLE_ID=MMETSP1067 /ASSEMBLY_ACC=CAM_ASM_000444 /LENGTH=235 /DNA_ID=CAMNT_0013339491 /DNA_START=51 /DNA_END=758 /DNA_ORIENTATION=-